MCLWTPNFRLRSQRPAVEDGWEALMIKPRPSNGLQKTCLPAFDFRRKSAELLA
jgi:hypothetical protein